jgi:hypothetical protein
LLEFENCSNLEISQALKMLQFENLLEFKFFLEFEKNVQKKKKGE